jgi:hypothetical protein
MKGKIEDIKNRYELYSHKCSMKNKLESEIERLDDKITKGIRSLFSEDVKKFADNYKEGNSVIDDAIDGMRDEWRVLAASCCAITKSFEISDWRGRAIYLHKEYGFKRFREYRAWDPFRYSMHTARNNEYDFKWDNYMHIFTRDNQKLELHKMVNNPRVNQKKAQALFTMTNTMCKLLMDLNKLCSKYEEQLRNANHYLSDSLYFDDRDDFKAMIKDAQKASKTLTNALGEFKSLSNAWHTEWEFYRKFNTEYKVLIQLTGKELKS